MRRVDAIGVDHAFQRVVLGHAAEPTAQPGHFVGKGYLKISFDRVILPNGDLPVPAKVIQAKDYKVDKKGDIDGKGHAKRDVVEWMIPPLWPWKVLMLPARGPRPTLKGEEPMELRLMDDIVIPHLVAYGPNRPPYASSSARPSADRLRPSSTTTSPSAAPAAEQPTTIPQATEIVAKSVLTYTSAQPTGRFTTVVLKSNEVIEVSKYQINGTTLLYRQLNGKEGSVDVNQVDWKQTTEMASGLKSVDLPAVADGAAGQIH